MWIGRSTLLVTLSGPTSSGHIVYWRLHGAIGSAWLIRTGRTFDSSTSQPTRSTGRLVPQGTSARPRPTIRVLPTLHRRLHQITSPWLGTGPTGYQCLSPTARTTTGH